MPEIMHDARDVRPGTAMLLCRAMNPVVQIGSPYDT